MSTALTTAGSFCGGGAGIQTILKMIVLNGVFAMRAFTASRGQNTTGVLFLCDLSGNLTEKSGTARGPGKDSPRRIFLLSVTHKREAGHHD